MKYKKIAFIGMMGSGKTTIAKMFADAVGKSAIDLDSLFENKYKISIKEFFKKFGEEKFRECEFNILNGILQNDEFIFSTGGGIVLSEKNRKLLFNNDVFTIYLSASAETIYNRIKNDNTRPLLLVQNPKEEIKKILNDRIKYYSMANITIVTENKTKDEIVKEIKKWIA